MASVRLFLKTTSNCAFGLQRLSQYYCCTSLMTALSSVRPCSAPGCCCSNRWSANNTKRTEKAWEKKRRKKQQAVSGRFRRTRLLARLYTTTLYCCAAVHTTESAADCCFGLGSHVRAYVFNATNRESRSTQERNAPPPLKKEQI